MSDHAALMTVKVIDPAERQRRLGKAYRLLIDLAREKRAAAQPTPSDTAEVTD